MLDDADEARERVARNRDGEALHDFRVALRRLRSWLRSFRPWFEGAVTKADRRRLRAIAQATSAARDIEVQLQGLAGLDLGPDADAVRASVGTALELRAPAAEREAIRAVHQFPDASSRLRERLPEFTDRVNRAAPGQFEPTASAAARHASVLLAELEGQVGAVTGTADTREVHDARIAAKRLRYLLEPFRADAASVHQAIRSLRRLQDDFGDHHDLDVLAATIRGLGEAGNPFSGAAAHVERARDALFMERVSAWQAGLLAGLAGRVRSAVHDLETRALGPGVEIERKFLLRALPPRRRNRESLRIEQGWIPGEAIVERIRRTRSAAAGTRWTRTLKLGHGLARIEVEDEIDEALFRRLWPLTRGCRLSKRRYVFREEGGTWEIDRFDGLDLVIAEIEIESETTPVEPPAWLERYIVREVTGDVRYENRNLAEQVATGATSPADPGTRNGN